MSTRPLSRLLALSIYWSMAVVVVHIVTIASGTTELVFLWFGYFFDQQPSTIKNDVNTTSSSSSLPTCPFLQDPEDPHVDDYGHVDRCWCRWWVVRIGRTGRISLIFGEIDVQSEDTFSIKIVSTIVADVPTMPGRFQQMSAPTTGIYLLPWTLSLVSTRSLETNGVFSLGCIFPSDSSCWPDQNNVWLSSPLVCWWFGQ